MHATQRATRQPAPVPQQSAPSHVVQIDTRAGFGALRAELHERAADQDLIALWRDLRSPERNQLLRSAEITAPDGAELSRLSQTQRDALRGAIHRMSGYARRLRARMETAAESAACQFARNAHRAVIEGDKEGAVHWLKLIEQGAV